MKLTTAFFGMAMAAVFVTPAAAQNASAEQGKTVSLQGAGATFPAPLYKQWVAAYKKVDPSTVIDYRAVGSGEGVKRFLDDSVDFGASDAAMTDSQITSAKQGAVLVPSTAGLIVLTYNLPGLGGPLKLNRDTYVALLMGKIPRWNDARIQASNPGLNLPDREVVLVARQDSSGTTYALTKGLSAISPLWRDRGPGIGKLVAWPSNTMLVRGNEGVASRVKMSVGSIGYVEYGFAKHLAMPTVLLENKEGNFVAPGEQAGEATIAANLSRIPANLRVFIPDPDGANAYPIVSFTWLLLKEKYGDPARSAALKRFVGWALSDGQAMGQQLGYIRLPQEMAASAKGALERIN